MGNTMCRISFFWIDYRFLAASWPLLGTRMHTDGCCLLHSFAFVSSVKMSCWQIFYDARSTYFFLLSEFPIHSGSVSSMLWFPLCILYEKRSPTINCYRRERKKCMSKKNAVAPIRKQSGNSKRSRWKQKHRRAVRTVNNSGVSDYFV